MFCGKCGSELEDGSLFCGNCGERADDAHEPESFGNDIEDFQTDYSGQYQEEREIVSDSSFYGMNNPAPVQDYNSYNVSQPASAPVKKNKSGVIIGVVIAVIAIAAAIGAAVFFLSGSDGDTDGGYPDSSDVDGTEDRTEPADTVEITGNTRILPAYEPGGIFAPEKLYNDVDYYVSCSIAALYKESGGYARGQIAQLDANDVVTVKGAMQDSNWVYVYCNELDIYGWIDPAHISSEQVNEYAAFRDNRAVVYYEDYECYDAEIDVGSGHNLNLRTAPTSIDASTIVREIPDDEVVRVIGVSAADSTWLYVCYDSFDYGKLYGFMSAEYLDRD